MMRWLWLIIVWVAVWYTWSIAKKGDRRSSGQSSRSPTPRSDPGSSKDCSHVLCVCLSDLELFHRLPLREDSVGPDLARHFTRRWYGTASQFESKVQPILVSATDSNDAYGSGYVVFRLPGAIEGLDEYAGVREYLGAIDTLPKDAFTGGPVPLSVLVEVGFQ